jgi:oligopeptide/dipeptide ABC transporter ATP-binding protein
MARLLEVRGLRTIFDTEDGEAPAVDGVDFHVDESETVGIVGESGCGKSVTALSIMRLVPSPPGRIAAGEVLFAGNDLLRLDEASMRAVRGNDIAMIFQEPMTSLNPVFTIGSQIVEAIRLHRGLGKREALEEAIAMLDRVEIPEARRRVDDYPHQLSGGMRQRVMIAIALSCGPRLLIADEPTTALDVTIQAQILDLLASLRASSGLAVMLITHDLGVVAEHADRILVMYAGRIVEQGRVADVLARPMHPYTRGLLASQPGYIEPGGRLKPVRGIVPPLTRLPSGCRFRDRCDYAIEQCSVHDPRLQTVAGGHAVACPVTIAKNGSAEQ